MNYSKIQSSPFQYFPYFSFITKASQSCSIDSPFTPSMCSGSSCHEKRYGELCQLISMLRVFQSTISCNWSWRGSQLQCHSYPSPVSNTRVPCILYSGEKVLYSLYLYSVPCLIVRSYRKLNSSGLNSLCISSAFSHILI